MHAQQCNLAAYKRNTCNEQIGISRILTKPGLYEPGNSVMWTAPYISRQLLEVHLNANIKDKLSPRNWEALPKGFWSEKPYQALSESYPYEEEKVILDQHILLDDASIKTYRFWNHFFSESDLSEILTAFDFKNISFHSQVIPDGVGYRSEDVTFCISYNSRESPGKAFS